MKVLRTMALTAVLAGSFVFSGGTLSARQAPPPAKQEVTIPGKTATMTATIEAIEQSSRTLTLKTDKGIYETHSGTARGEAVLRAQGGRQDHGALRRQRGRPNEEARRGRVGSRGGRRWSKARRDRLPRRRARSGRSRSRVTAMDAATSSVTVTGPNGYVYTRRVADKKAFAQLKVGDKLDMTWTQAMLICVEPAK